MSTADNKPLADALDLMSAQLDPVDDWRPSLDKAATELRRLHAEVERLRTACPPAEMPCEWRLSDRADGIWTASCSDLLYSFADGGPIENGHRHCHGCGRVLVVAADREGGAA